MSDSVNHPDHYGGDVPHEVIKCINAWGLDFNLGNAVKYIARAGRKGDSLDDTIEDLEKARFYIEDSIARLENEQATIAEAAIAEAEAKVSRRKRS